MTIGEYFGKTKGTFPKPGVVGVESDWMFASVFDVSSGTLWAGDPWVVDRRNGCAVTVEKGVYGLNVKGMDFKGHRRVSRVRACLSKIARPTLGKPCGQTGTDCATIALFDLAAYRKAVTSKHAKEYEHDLKDITKEEGIGVMSMSYGGKQFDIALQPSGLGDGTFTVYPLLFRGKTVGMEVEFLPPGFSLDSDTARAGAAAEAPKKTTRQPEPDKRSRARAREFLRACKKGDAGAVKLLLKEDRDLIDARGPIGFYTSLSPLHFAAMFGHADVAELLLKAGHPVDAVDEWRGTPLMNACRRSMVDVVRVLLKHRANVNAKNTHGSTALHDAASAGIGNAEIVRMLLAAGADHKAKDTLGRTPLVGAKSGVGVGFHKDPKFPAEQEELKKVIEILAAHAKKR